MGSCASKSSCCGEAVTRVLMRATTTRPAAVHPWTPPPEVPPGQRVTVRMRASEFRALAVGTAAGAGTGAEDGDGDVGRLILDGCAAGLWAWSPAPER
ncbi:hypothetical protein BAE44_0011533 [Dichanthelium oligosanthes]|uniref:Uncharacterized protein n=1 Tax=Dichanthelium oligosanthes TaxID=888268 RepID=A0A1E5VQR4_9POAL|nr:hypothetical protein BAE44_0011533 [Dichanthelium oligosanthes]